MLDSVDLERGISAGSLGTRTERKSSLASEVGPVTRCLRVFKAQSIVTCSLLFSLFVLMSLVAVVYVQQTGRGPLKSSFGCDLHMAPPHSSNRTVNLSYCEVHRPETQINKDIHDKIITSAFQASIRFLVVGDFGRDGFCCQRDVAWEMARAAGTIQPHFIANGGDSFYDFGLLSEMEEQVDTSWRDVYMKHESLKSLPWYSVLGNHEYRGSASAVLSVPQRYPQFVMPDRFYDHEFVSDDRKFRLHMFYLDTSPMIQAYHVSGYDDRADSMLNQPDGIRSQWNRVEEQIAWLEQGLNSSTADIKVVMGHHPVYTSGAHYGEDERFLRKRIAPILEKNGVLLYISGHDHNLQEYWKLYSPTHYIVSAGGSKVEGAFTQGDVHLRYFDQVNGFCAVEASAQGLRIVFVDYVGNVIRTINIAKQQPGPPPS